jgi:hypothetical protein
MLMSDLKPGRVEMRTALQPILVALGIFITSAVVTAQDGISNSTVRAQAKAAISANNELPFPPGFLGHPIAYAAAIFGQLTVLSFAVMVMAWSLANLDLNAGRGIIRGKITKWTLINIYRVRWILIMMAVCLGVTGNLLIYLTWGEVSIGTMEVFLTIDKSMKALAAVPFVACVYLLVTMDEAHASQLSIAKMQPEPLWPVAPQIREQYRAIALIFGMAILVTFAKAYGLDA